MSSLTPSYWCHRCTQFITISPQSTAVTCPHCRTGFVESLPTSASSAAASRRRRRDRSPFNPVIVLRDRPEENRTFQLYYDDDAATGTDGSGLRPVPVPVSEFLMGSGFDRLLDQLSAIELAAPSEGNPPPASKSAIEALPSVTISECHVGAEARCAVCTEAFEAGTEAREMPCKHMYHYECIVPWLSIRNTCPVCRAALPGSEEAGQLTEPSPIGLTIWRLPGGGYAVGRWRGGVERERELPAVYTEMDGGGFGEGPRRVSWGSRSGRTRNLGGFTRAFRGFVSFFGRFRAEGSSGPMVDRSRSSGFARRRR